MSVSFSVILNIFVLNSIQHLFLILFFGGRKNLLLLLVKVIKANEAIDIASFTKILLWQRARFFKKEKK